MLFPAQKLAIVPKNPYICVYQAIDSINTFVGSSGPHYVDIVGVKGSIPVTPTISPIRKMHEYSGIWCIRSGGTDLERMTSGTSVDWVPHPSPGGKTILYLSCVAGSEGHPRNPHADLGLLHLKDG